MSKLHVDPTKIILWFQRHTPRWVYKLSSVYVFRPRRILLTATILNLSSRGIGRPLRWASELWSLWAIYESGISIETNIRVDLAVIVPVVFGLTGVAAAASILLRRFMNL
jgi:hypothetical protein